MYPYRFVFSAKENEQIDAVFKLPEQKKSVLYGRIIDTDSKPVNEAVIRIFEVAENEKKHVAFTFSDEQGEFVYGPLKAQCKYEIRVYSNDIIVRRINMRPRKRK